MNTSIQLWQILLMVASACLLYIAVVVVYRLMLHPLAKYPGPFLSKITDWSIVLQAKSGDRHLESSQEHKKYGSIVRIAPNTLSFNTTTALKSIYASRRPAPNVQKSEWYRTLDSGSGAFSTHSEIDRTKHAFRRRILDHAFSDAALREAESFVLENVRGWCEALGRTEGGEDVGKGEWTLAKNMTDWANYLSYDIMGDLAFGKRFECVEKNEHRFVPALMMSGTEFVYVLGFNPFISLIRPLIGTWVANLIFGGQSRDSATYIAYANAQIDARIAEYEASKSSKTTSESTSTRKSLTDHLLRACDPITSKGLTTLELHADSALLIAAGADTVSVTISAALFYLLRHPPSLARITAEIRDTFPSDPLTSSHLNQKLISCTYLRACIDETLRLAPPVPSHLPRDVLPGGMVVDGEMIPEGTVVGVGAYAIHHNEMYYPESWAWRPERWLDGDKGNLKEIKEAFFPFSVGSRGCVGRGLAYMEVGIALAGLFWGLDVKLSEEGAGPSGDGGLGEKRAERRRVGEYQLYDHFSAGRDGPMVRFRRRGV